MLKHYSPNFVEKLIEKVYYQNEIRSPHDLDIERIATIWSIDLEYTNTARAFAIWGSSTRRIFLPNSLPIVDRRAVFFHELCHVLRHEGNQRTMTTEFRQLQEVQADQFVLFAAMPYFMIRDYLYERPSIIAETFQVPIKYVHKRLTYIKNQIFVNSEMGIRFDKPRWSPETIKVLHQLNHILLNKQHYRYYGI